MSQPEPARRLETVDEMPSESSVVLPAGWDVISTAGDSVGIVGGYADSLPPILAPCDECGATSEFPAEANGTIQKCPQCEDWMDVGGEEWFDEAEAAGDVDDFLELLPPLKGCGCGPEGCS